MCAAVFHDVDYAAEPNAAVEADVIVTATRLGLFPAVASALDVAFPDICAARLPEI